MKYVLATGEAFGPQKRTSSTSSMKFLYFFYFCEFVGHCSPPPGSESGPSRLISMRIQTNPDLDLQHFIYLKLRKNKVNFMGSRSKVRKKNQIQETNSVYDLHPDSHKRNTDPKIWCFFHPPFLSSCRAGWWAHFANR
jgi:hypothetical protein